MTKVYVTKDVKEALSLYKKTAVLVFPTDTVYGIGADIYNETAIKNIYEIKHRSFDKPLAVLCADKNQILHVAKSISPSMQKLLDAFMPGGFTAVLPKRETVPDFITGGADTVGVRIPNHPVALEILQRIGPLAVTSLNISGEPTINNAFDAMDVFGKDVDIVIYGDDAGIGIPSTVVTESNGKIVIIRKGLITKQMIDKVLKY